MLAIWRGEYAPRDCPICERILLVWEWVRVSDPVPKEQEYSFFVGERIPVQLLERW